RRSSGSSAVAPAPRLGRGRAAARVLAGSGRLPPRVRRLRVRKGIPCRRGRSAREELHVSERTLPWYAMRPYVGCNGKRMQHSVWDADGNFACECDGDDEGHDEAVAICEAVNRMGPRECAHCGEPATCFGSYEDELHPAYACDECCGHGNEDGR